MDTVLVFYSHSLLLPDTNHDEIIDLFPSTSTCDSTDEPYRYGIFLLPPYLNKIIAFVIVFSSYLSTNQWWWYPAQSINNEETTNAAVPTIRVSIHEW